MERERSPERGSWPQAGRMSLVRRDSVVSKPIDPNPNAEAPEPNARANPIPNPNPNARTNPNPNPSPSPNAEPEDPSPYVARVSSVVALLLAHPNQGSP